MNKNEFWTIIDKANNLLFTDSKEKVQTIINTLLNYDYEEIIEFERYLRQFIIEADHFDILAAAKIINGNVFDDSYLYFRCWIIVQGKKNFEKAMVNADNIADFIEPSEVPDFEELLTISTEVAKKKFPKDDDPRDICADEGFDYDLNTPPTKGTDWFEDELPIKLPKLWKKYKENGPSHKSDK